MSRLNSPQSTNRPLIVTPIKEIKKYPEEGYEIAPDEKQITLGFGNLAKQVNQKKPCFEFNQRNTKVIDVSKSCFSTISMFYSFISRIQNKQDGKFLCFATIQNEDIFIRTENHLHYVYAEIQNETLEIVNISDTMWTRLSHPNFTSFLGEQISAYMSLINMSDSQDTPKTLEEQIQEKKVTNQRRVLYTKAAEMEETRYTKTPESVDQTDKQVTIAVFNKYAKLLTFINAALYALENKPRADGVVYSFSYEKSVALVDEILPQMIQNHAQTAAEKVTHKLDSYADHILLSLVSHFKIAQKKDDTPCLSEEQLYSLFSSMTDDNSKELFSIVLNQLEHNDYISKDQHYVLPTNKGIKYAAALMVNGQSKDGIFNDSLTRMKQLSEEETSE